MADLDLGIADDHADDEVFDELALLLPGRLCQAVPHPVAERFRALGVVETAQAKPLTVSCREHANQIGA